MFCQGKNDFLGEFQSSGKATRTGWLRADASGFREDWIAK